MHVWVVVLALLALAVFFLFISLFLKDNQNEEEIDEEIIVKIMLSSQGFFGWQTIPLCH